jgi:putative transposase
MPAAGRYFVRILVEDAITPLPPVAAPRWGLTWACRLLSCWTPARRSATPRISNRMRSGWPQPSAAAPSAAAPSAAAPSAQKHRGSPNRAQARQVVARLDARRADRRRDFLQKLAPRRIRENQTICVESLRGKALVPHPTRAKAIHEVGWGEFVRQLTYQAAWYGRTRVALAKWYPRSKRRPDGGQARGSLARATRQWTCPAGGVTPDRDGNAARNSKAAGLAVAAGGEAISPGRVRPPAASLREAGIPRL